MRPVYVFFHIPKCAGTSLTHQVRARMDPETYLALYDQPYKDKRRKMVYGLGPSRAEVLRLVFGHDAYDGVHEDLGRSGRYFTVLRHPVDRVVSHYNFKIDYWLIKKDRQVWDNDYPYLEDGRPMPFEEWIERYPHVNDVMTRYISRSFMNWTDRGKPFGDEDLERASERLRGFYYVGMTETFDTESQMIYGWIGLRGYRVVRKNLSYPHYRLTDPALRAKVLRLNARDLELLELGRRLNRGLKLRRSYYVGAPIYHLRRAAHQVFYNSEETLS
ncbi:MAG: hypothetical protein MOGMAGMI_02219 [Candidatus Omnitrophica bacterium]|nr:hypothetical protein [Candidatus Omnitrophota bacterium]